MQSCVFGFARKSPFFMQKLGMRDALRVQFTRGVSCIRVFCRAFGDASSKTWILRHATFSFPRQRGEPFETSAEGKC